MVHDVTTDPADPPQFVALRATRLKCRNGAHYSGGMQHHAGIDPHFLALRPAKLFQAALAAANTMRWDIAAADASEGRIEATATTPLLRFKDDVVIRVRPAGDGARLDIRSASRVGRSDLGANARRIRGFFEKLHNCLKTNT